MPFTHPTTLTSSRWQPLQQLATGVAYRTEYSATRGMAVQGNYGLFFNNNEIPRLLRGARNDEGEWATARGRQCRQAMRTRPCGGNPADLIFLVLFLSRKKVQSKINMNGRLYDPVIGRFFSPDNYVQAPEFTQSLNRYSYCLNNPLKYIDPTGQSINNIQYQDYYYNLETGREEWREGNENWIDDHYFNEKGKYLGDDLAKTDNIRIINQETWDKYGANISFTGNDGETIISRATALLLSKELSELNLSNKSALNIYKHYNSTDYKLVSEKGNYNMKTRGDDRTIAVNLERNNRDKISYHYNEIKNLFSHEGKHVSDIKVGFEGEIWQWEQRAIKVQMADPTFPLTKPSFQNAVQLYGIENKMKF
jgi:RHS repeat-associated protein